MENNLIGIIVLLLGFTATIGNSTSKNGNFTNMVYCIELYIHRILFIQLNSRFHHRNRGNKNPLYITISILFITLILQ
jgi:hypothetical protein